MKLRHEANSLSRRRFLKWTAMGTGLAALGPIAGTWPTNVASATAKADHKRLIIVNMRGGVDSLNFIPPIGLSQYYARRPNIAISSASALSLAGGPGTSLYGLHPNLSTVQSEWNSGNAAILTKVGYPQANLSHFISEDIWSWGMRYGGYTGWIARWADKYNLSSFGLIAIGQGALKDFIGAQLANPISLDSLARFGFAADLKYPDHHKYRRQVIEKILRNGEYVGLRDTVRDAEVRAVDLFKSLQGTFSGSPQSAYGNTDIGRRLRDVAILIDGGFDTRMFYTGYGGFDTHSAQGVRQDTLFGNLNQALSGLITDLTAFNAWKDTVVLVISEFGRRNFENGSAGTDHGHANFMLALGGPVNGGIYGSPLTDADLLPQYLAYQTDFRTVYNQLLVDHMGDSLPAAGTSANIAFPESMPKPASPGAFV